MPTIIAIDVSLSMFYKVSGFETGEKHSRLQLAIHAVNILLDYLSIHSKLEYVATVAYSSKAEIISSFTRDYELIKTKLSGLEVKDKTNYESLIKLLNRMVISEWGSCTPCQIILITDGSSSFESLVPTATTTMSFPSSVTIASIAPADDMYSPIAMQKILKFFDSSGKVVKTDSNVDIDSLTTFMRDLAKENYSSSNAALKCGGIVSKIQLLPPPMPYTSLIDFEMKTNQVSNVIEICGFIDNVDVGTPAAVSRHLVLPIAGTQENTVLESFEDMEVDEGTSHDDGKIPSFCVLLHGALKVENMVALCELGSNWYGILFSWTDSKKRSNLMLIVLEPEKVSVPWIGNFKYLGTLPNENIAPETDECFPVRPPEKRSYNQNLVVWVKQSGLQSDVQKILRQARKLPEKTNNFYKELNRLRRAAISFGFVELLDGVADIFERECTMLPGSAHPDCALQLTHSAGILRRPVARDAKYSIPPMRTKFVSGIESYGKI